MILEEIARYYLYHFRFVFAFARYHNGRRLPELTVGMKSSLFISNVDGAQGLYTCKATNTYGSEMSSPGELKIKGKTFFLDSC